MSLGNPLPPISLRILALSSGHHRSLRKAGCMDWVLSQGETKQNRSRASARGGGTSREHAAMSFILVIPGVCPRGHWRALLIALGEAQPKRAVVSARKGEFTVSWRS